MAKWGSIICYDGQDGKVLAEFPVSGWVRTIACTDDGSVCAVGTDKLTIMNVNSPDAASWTVESSPDKLAISPEGGRCAWVTDEGGSSRLHILSMDNSTHKTFTGPPNTTLHFLREDLLLFAARMSTAIVVEVPSGREVCRFSEAPSIVVSTAVRADRTLYVEARYHGSVRLLDTRVDLPLGPPAESVIQGCRPPDLSGITESQDTWPDRIPNPDFGKCVAVRAAELICEGLQLGGEELDDE